MYVESLWVQGFRALAEQNLTGLQPFTVVEGINGAGKTTLLDALYFLAAGKSFLGLSNGELVRDGSPYFVVGGQYRARDPVAAAPVSHAVQAMYTREGHKELRIDGAVYRGFVHLIGGLRVAQFNFNSVFLVKGMPSIRRQYINLLIASCDREYLGMLATYSGVVARKNALLRQVNAVPPDPQLLDLFDEQIVALSNAIYDKRRTALSAIGSAMDSLIGEGMFQQLADVTITYHPRVLTSEAVHALRERELLRHTCLAGCHLDDFVLLRKEHQLRETASLGEAKLVALLLTFAGAEYVRASTGEYPVLLLDDLEGDIDTVNLKRLTQLLGRFEQVFMTSFDFARLQSGLDATFIRL